MCTLHSPTAPFPHRQGHNRVLCALPKTVCVLKHNASNPFYTTGSVPCVLFLSCFVHLLISRTEFLISTQGAFPLSTGCGAFTVSSLCLLGPSRWAIWVVSNLLLLQTTVGWTLPLATCDCNCRGESWEWNCWVQENVP